MDYVYLICLLAMNAAFYYLGRSDGKAAAYPLDEEAQYDLEVYKIDKYYEHQRWLEERKASHE